MHDKPYVALVDAHAESRCRNDDVHPTRHKLILILYLLVRIHLAVERQSLHPVTSELRGKFVCALRARHIYNGRA